MRILFATSHFGFLRNFEAGIRALAERGHEVRLLADRGENIGGGRTAELLTAAYPSVTTVRGPSRKDWTWQTLAVNLRLCLDYWRYLHPRYRHAPALRQRAAGQVPPFAVSMGRLPVLRSRPIINLLSWFSRRFEQALPAAPQVAQLLVDEHPDILVVTPLLYFGSSQVDYVRAARHLGIPSLLCVGSWDHLTTKGLIHEAPDRLTVWNELQRQEAAELHGIPPDHVVVTGSTAYDHWFVSQPSTSREAFCSQVGLPADRPILLYLCSSPFITPHEVPFVRRWLAAIRASSDPALRQVAVLVRPHPQNAEQWRDVSLSDQGPAAIWPATGANPVDAASRSTYFDSMYHSLAVVGVNTSALIESGIVGRAVFTLAVEEFAGTQEGTLHFQHLKNAGGGLLTMATTLPSHIEQLADCVRQGPPAEPPGRAFIKAFIRPHGLDAPVGPRFAETVETIARTVRPDRPRVRRSDRFIATLLRPAALAVHAAARARKLARKQQKPAL